MADSLKDSNTTVVFERTESKPKKYMLQVLYSDQIHFHSMGRNTIADFKPLREYALHVDFVLRDWVLPQCDDLLL